MLKKCLVLIGASVLLAGPWTAAAVQAAKPAAPLQIRIVTDTPGQVRPGATVRVTVAAVCFVDAAELSIHVDLTGAAKLVSGETIWTGPVRKGEEKELILTVSVPELGHAGVRAHASLLPGGRGRFSAESSMDLVPVPKKKSETPPVKKDSRGRDIIEYR